MSKRFIIFFAVLALAHALVPYPRLKRAVHDELTPAPSPVTTTTPTVVKDICPQQTACQWLVYNPKTKYDPLDIKNSECDCAVGTSCQLVVDDRNLNSFVYHCRPISTSEPENTDD